MRGGAPLRDRLRIAAAQHVRQRTKIGPALRTTIIGMISSVASYAT
jgi:hypothetical protein